MRALIIEFKNLQRPRKIDNDPETIDNDPEKVTTTQKKVQRPRNRLTTTQNWTPHYMRALIIELRTPEGAEGVSQPGYFHPWLGAYTLHTLEGAEGFRLVSSWHRAMTV